MRAAVDLHIHSCLSPCADDDMTPCNIVNMAVIKGLDIIAVTDHNSGKNVSSVIEAAREKNILILPGMEVQSREEVHLLCYFETLDQLLAFDGALYPHIPDIRNKPELFGNQWIYKNLDEAAGMEDKLLISAVNLSIEQIVDLVLSHGGVAVPAHVDKPTNSLLSNLGFIPEHLDFQTLEISKGAHGNHTFLDKYRLLLSSDAHHLGIILEREFFLDISEISTTVLIELLKNSPSKLVY